MQKHLKKVPICKVLQLWVLFCETTVKPYNYYQKTSFNIESTLFLSSHEWWLSVWVLKTTGFDAIVTLWKMHLPFCSEEALATSLLHTHQQALDSSLHLHSLEAEEAPPPPQQPSLGQRKCSELGYKKHGEHWHEMRSMTNTKCSTSLLHSGVPWLVVFC